MSDNPERNLDLLAHLEAVEDLAYFKEEWADVIEPTLKEYDVTAAERVLIIDDLYKNYTENEDEEVLETDVVDSIHAIRAASQDLH